MRASHRSGLVALLLVTSVTACSQRPGASKRDGVAGSVLPAPKSSTKAALPSAKQPETATGLDPTAMDEGLMQALGDLRNKFRCNSISGCPAHQVLVDFRRHAVRPLKELFPRAPAKAAYRARIVRILAEIELPELRSWLRARITDDSDKARGYAVYGLALLGDPRDQPMLKQFAEAPGIIASAMTRTAAAWGLAFQHHPRGQERFIALLREAASHQLGGATLRWGLELCQRPNAPTCAPIFTLAAGHPSYVVRREVLRTIHAPWAREELQALVVLVSDPNPNLARKANRALINANGGQAMANPEAWRRWLAARR